MPTFSYRALQSDGRMADGVAEAASRPEALRIIEGKGLRPVSVTEARGGGSRSSKPGKEVAAQNTGMPGFSFGAAKVSKTKLDKARSIPDPQNK